MYFYCLGHQPNLGIAEYISLSKNQNIEIRSNWLLGESFLDVNLAGSLVFGGEILASSEADLLWPTIQEVLQKLQANSPIKKLGLFLPENEFLPSKKQILDSAKRFGYKKINTISVLPNFGHWKSGYTWLVVFQFGKKWQIGKIETYSNQEFWSKIDQNLPCGDMRRGLINLKLARTLLNLTDQKTVWDPFCGQGRLLIAGLDIKEKFLASDIDPEVLPDLITNFEFAKNTFQRFWPPRMTAKNLAILEKNWQLDAIELQKNDFDCQKTAIVTEGFLGANFNYHPKHEEMKKEWQNLQRIWQQIILKAEKLKIPELIFCLPFYQTKTRNFLPDFIYNLTTKTNYKLQKFG
jgi:hypothetical protein